MLLPLTRVGSLYSIVLACLTHRFCSLCRFFICPRPLDYNAFGRVFLHPLFLHSRLQELKGLKEGEEPEEDGPAEEGVTFDVWKKTELPPPPEPVFDEVRIDSCVFIK